MDVRPLHMEHAGEGFKNEWIIKAGATFADDHDVEPKKMTGSWFLIREENMVKAKERLARDVYSVGHAWDMSKVS